VVKTGATPAISRPPPGATPTPDLTRPPPGATAVQPAPTQAPALLRDLSLMEQPPTLPPSKTPMIAGLAIAAVVLVGLAAVFLRPKPADEGKAPQQVKTAEPVKAGEPVKAAEGTTPDAQKGADPAAAAALQAIARSELNSSNFTRGQAEFEAASFENAETFLSRIPESSDLHAQAVELLGKIKLIREALAAGQGEFARGSCERAVPQYRKVLSLNARVKEATAGLQRCREAAIDPTMP
jgi:hypothetical protein